MAHGLPSPKEQVALELLSSGKELYGLELVKLSGGELKRGTIYVLLGRLEDAGFVTSHVSNDPSSPGGRRLYKIHGHGLRALKASQQAAAYLNTALAFGA